MTPLFVALVLVSPIACRRLVVAPQVDNEWDSVLVSSDPIRVTESGKKNGTPSARAPDYAIRLHRNAVDTEGRSAGTNCKYNHISCLYGTEAPAPETEKPGNRDIIDKFIEQYSSITNAKFNTDGLANETEAEVKSYWGGSGDRDKHPFDDKKGWVTLETVPWSTSMVSKWQPNVQPTHPSPSSVSTIHQHQPGVQQQFAEDKPWQYGAAGEQPAVQSWGTRPTPVTTNYGSYTPVASQPQQTKPISQWGLGNNDIITDNRPNNFPIGNSGGGGGGGGYGQFQSSPLNHQNRFPIHSHEQDQHPMGSHQVPQPMLFPTIMRHPSTYPDAGNGEWVLLSTTKGYSMPNGYRGPGKTMAGSQIVNHVMGTETKPGRNPEISRYHEEDIEFEEPRAFGPKIERKSDVGVAETTDGKGLRVLRSEDGSKIYAAERDARSKWTMEDSPVEILYSSKDEERQEPPVTLRRTVRLQVLPPVNKTTMLAHDGLLEVDQSHQTVEEEHKAMEEDKIKQLSKIANVRRNNFTLFRVIPTPVKSVTGKSMREKKTAILAAMGAGMIPATMAVLVPMALGRKKRSLSPAGSNIVDQQRSAFGFYPGEPVDHVEDRWG